MEGAEHTHRHPHYAPKPQQPGRYVDEFHPHGHPHHPAYAGGDESGHPVMGWDAQPVRDDEPDDGDDARYQGQLAVEGHALALQADVERLRGILARLAEHEPERTLWKGLGCHYCDGPERSGPGLSIDHEAGCPWWQARQLSGGSSDS